MESGNGLPRLPAPKGNRFDMPSGLRQLRHCYLDSPQVGFTHYSCMIDLTVNQLHQD